MGRWICGLALGIGLCMACQKVELPEEGGEKEEVNAGLPGPEEQEPDWSLPEELPTIDGHQALAVGEVLKMTPDIDETSCWVVGYVVGYTSRSIHNAVFSTEGAVRSNILLADRKEEDNTARCLPVELDQTALKECLSLADNPGLWKCRIGVYGKVKTYFRVTGLREVGDFEWLEADEPGVLPDPGPDPEPTPDPDPGPEEGTHVKDTLGIDEGGMVIPGGRTARIG